MTEEVCVQVKWLDHDNRAGLRLPAYHSDLAAGMDIQAAIEADVILAPGERVLLPTNVAMAIAPGYEIQVRPRSGLAIKHGVTVVNSPGTIDADYRGEIKVGLINLGDKDFAVTRGIGLRNWFWRRSVGPLCCRSRSCRRPAAASAALVIQVCND